MDLSTQYMGLTLKNPIVPSASPISKSLDGIKKLEDAGAAAIVMYSLFEEQIAAEGQQLDHFLTYGTDTFAESLSYFPDLGNYNIGPEAYLDLIAKAKSGTSVPIIGSLNGVSAGGWTRYARLIEEAGADGLELNIYYIPTDPTMTGAEVEKMYVDVLGEVKKSVNIPVAIKIGPYFSAMANMASKLSDAGANALVLFNRFYQPDFNLDSLAVEPGLVLSNSWEMRLPLRWTAVLYGRVKADLAITSGIHTHTDVLKCLMAGANCVQIASLLLEQGVDAIGTLLNGLESWMTEFEYDSVAQMRGSMSQKNCAEPAAFERANYMKVLQSWREDSTGRSL